MHNQQAQDYNNGQVLHIHSICQQVNKMGLFRVLCVFNNQRGSKIICQSEQGLADVGKNICDTPTI